MTKKNKGLKIEDLLLNFLFHYRNTPSTVTNETPNEILLSYLPRNKILFLKPEADPNDNNSNKRQIEKLTNRTKTSNAKDKNPVSQSYVKGDRVWYRTNSTKLVKWIPAKILGKLSSLVYNIQLERGNIRKAHLCQLKKNIVRSYPNYHIVRLPTNKRRRSESCSPNTFETRLPLSRPPTSKRRRSESCSPVSSRTRYKIRLINN